MVMSGMFVLLPSIYVSIFTFQTQTDTAPELSDALGFISEITRNYAPK